MSVISPHMIPFFVSVPYIEVKVDVHKGIALPVGALVIELSNLPILLLNDLEARSVRLLPPITRVQLTLRIRKGYMQHCNCRNVKQRHREFIGEQKKGNSVKMKFRSNTSKSHFWLRKETCCEWRRSQLSAERKESDLS